MRSTGQLEESLGGVPGRRTAWPDSSLPLAAANQFQPGTCLAPGASLTLPQGR